LKYQTKEAIVISIDHATKEHATLVLFTHTHTHTHTHSQSAEVKSFFLFCALYISQI